MSEVMGGGLVGAEDLTLTMLSEQGKVQIYTDNANSEHILIRVSRKDAALLAGWMQLAGVCLQTWPQVAHDLLLQAKRLRLI